MSDHVEEQVRLGLRLLAEEVQPPAGGVADHRPKRLKYYAGVIALACAAAVIAGVSLSGREKPVSVPGHGGLAGPTGLVGPTGPMGPDVTPTMEQPLRAPGARQVSLSDASNALEGSLVFPDTPQVGPSDVGAVWMSQAHGETKADIQTGVSVTFPSQDLIIGYARPAPRDPLAYFRATTGESARVKLIWLGSTPAAYYDPGSPDYWAVVEVIVGGTRIDVLGHTSEASLEAIAQSIVDQANVQADH